MHIIPIERSIHFIPTNGCDRNPAGISRKSIVSLCTMQHVQGDAVETSLRHLNEVCPTIKFTMEQEKDGSLPFLDTSLTWRKDGTLNVTVFRKQTHTDRYLHFNSHHPASAKRAAIRSLFNWARNITLWKEDLRKEEHLTAAFRQNGYPLSFICATSTSMQIPSTSPEEPDEEPDDEESQEEEKQPLAVTPYVSGVSEQIRKPCEKYNFKVIFKSFPTLCSLLTKVKDPSPRRNWQVWSTRFFSNVVRCMLGKDRGTWRRELKNTGMRAIRGTQGNLPLQSISGISNIKWIGKALGCWTEPLGLSSSG